MMGQMGQLTHLPTLLSTWAAAGHDDLILLKLFIEQPPARNANVY